HPGPSPRAWGSQGGYHVGGGSPVVHPHVRGAHLAIDTDGEIVIGPSPRAWGSLVRHGRAAETGRSIPTCVGLTAGTPSPQTSHAVHPHVRGAHVACPGSNRRPIGPSPRAWGSRGWKRRIAPSALVHPHVR